ncbi:hypothetical protein DXG03_006252 [Asterophora parasitica]|uniref:G-patch domain-containing protein n=1 Tax=Asterophora parasitica TaxID=117018 RepID=A0A9P7G8F5_9AGAR|nr:hypothetical protein DXG03_006252 [Asterophora parasitica]
MVHAAKFGSSYLSKFGWDASKGLGVDGEGRTSHIKVSHKLDMLGIGAAHQMDPNGIAWKQNKDFENLLKRLNAQENTSAADTVAEVKEEIKEEKGESEGEEEKETKRKRKKDREGASEEKAKKKRKKTSEDADKGELKAEAVEEETKVAATPPEPARPFVPRNRAHRARAIASKSIASKSAASIAEILGIAPTPSTSASSGSGTPAGGKLTPLDDGTVTLEKLTTSTKSVADYFKEKLLAKSSSKSGSGSVTPGTPVEEEEEPYEDAAPRGGLGSSRLKVEVAEESLDSQSQRIGLSKFSSLMTSTFLSATTLLTPSELATPATEEPIKKEKKQKEKKRSREEEEDGSEAPVKEKRKKKRSTEEEGGSEEVPVKDKKKRSRKEEDGSEVPLSKEERRQLRKEKKKSRKESEDSSS